MHLQKAFEQIDSDNSGTISVDELGTALRQFGVYDDAQELLASADKNQVCVCMCVCVCNDAQELLASADKNQVCVYVCVCVYDDAQELLASADRNQVCVCVCVQRCLRAAGQC